jgi:hypothetical protein
MTALTWDDVGERIYQTGIDRGVLYIQDNPGVPWNGLTSVDDSPATEVKAYYLDGAKYLQNISPGDFVGKLKAYTYPEEFESVNGVSEPAPGIHFHEQVPKSFSLTYRTKIGNDVDGADHGYKIHILYNVVADPDSVVYQTATDSGAQPIEFGWSLTGTPVHFPGMRPLVHLSFDSTEVESELFETLEGILYGTDDDEPRLPTIIEVALLFGYLGALVIVDNGDGTWTATDLGSVDIPAYITMIDETTFEIDDADVTYLDAETYLISDTFVGWP